MITFVTLIHLVKWIFTLERMYDKIKLQKIRVIDMKKVGKKNSNKRLFGGGDCPKNTNQIIDMYK